MTAWKDKQQITLMSLARISGLFDKDFVMESGRMPACATLPLVGESVNTSVLGVSLQGDDNQVGCPTQSQISQKGNRCGHDKNSFKRPEVFGRAKKRPHVLEEAKRRIYAGISDHFRFPAFSGLFYHQDQDGKGNGRHIRSERIEGTHSLTLPILLQHIDLYRMACGHYDNRNQFRFYNYAFIENATDQSSIRVKREMKLLQDRGIIKVITLREQNNDGSWRTPEVRIEFTDKIFEMLELMPEFLKDRETSAIKFHAKQARLDKNQKKREFYRKTSFTPPSTGKTSKISPTLSPSVQYLAKSVVRGIPQSKPGNGVEVRDKINALVRQGLSVKDAMEIVKQQYPPKH